MSAIWFGMMALGFLYCTLHSGPDAVSAGALNAARYAVETSFGLLGVTCMWLGFMKIAERAGLVALISNSMGPVVRRLFPDVPSGHPALTSICLNVAANVIGMGSAATPLGLKAMQELKEAGTTDEASRPMCTFVVLNTAGFTLLPASVVALRASLGSSSPAATVGVTMLAGLAATAVGLALDKIFNR